MSALSRNLDIYLVMLLVRTLLAASNV